MKISVIDYGMGNIFSVCSALRKIGYDFVLTCDRQEILKSDRIILPGVGAFEKAMFRLKNLNLDSIIKDYVNTGNPMLGICIGMQVMMTQGEEGNGAQGLNIFEGNVKKIDPYKLNEKRYEKLPVPHIAWSKVIIPEENKQLIRFLPQEKHMYFVHSFHCLPLQEKYKTSFARYGGEKITASIQKDNVLGTQFHPERSGPQGLNFIKNFIEQK